MKWEDDTTIIIINESKRVEDLPEEIKDHIIQATDQSDYKHRDEELHVTELLYCLRKAYYRRMAEKEGEASPEKQLAQRWYLYRGIIFDEAWTSLFVRNQVRVTHRVPNGPTIVGKIDFIENDTVWDLKTISNEYAIKEGPKPAHVKQVLFYAWVQNFSKAGLIYLHLGGVHLFELDTTPAEEVVRELEDKARKLYFALKSGDPPERVDTWECRYCEFKTICTGGAKQ